MHSNKIYDAKVSKEEYTFAVDAAPTNWLAYAEELYDAANLCLKHGGYELNRSPDFTNGPTLLRAFFLNFGFSMENLLKGLLIAENNSFIDNGRISSEISKAHDLNRLADKVVSLKLSSNEKKLLKILSDAIPYWGRYPIPKKAESWLKKVDLTPMIIHQMNVLWMKIGTLLYAKIKAGWVGPYGINTGLYLDSRFEESMADAINDLNELDQFSRNEMMGNVDLSKTSYKTGN